MDETPFSRLRCPSPVSIVYRNMANVHQNRLVRLPLLAAAMMLVLAGVSRGQGQYVQVIPLSDLDYGVVSSNNGEVSVGKTYDYVGKFQIRARVAVPPGSFPEVDLTFLPPSALNGPGDTIMYTMEASTNSQGDSPTSSTTTSGTTARITLEDYEGTESGLPVYSAYAYVFGSLFVENASSGGYIAPLRLEAEVVTRVPPVCRADPWERRKRYYAGDTVTHDDAAWEATRFTIGNEPGKAHDWDDWEDESDEDEGDDDGDDDDDRGRGKSRGDDDDDGDNKKGNGEPGGGRPWDLITICS